ncbi:uncharacterized protein K02A2.6-like [Protobothrops mucrosquamatus]|uniref:uncharacterized protein K02A2.6-like n=1 Tax=Protobothrops mucrosquamatus TaxID=103944 RepID=UPI0010FB5052|nr:uncharacterized protein K02A2.6-like [Protobothrops mucrosquamatus]
MSKISRISEFDTSHPERWSSYVARVENYFRVNQVHRWEETHAPWSRVHIDYAGPFQGQFFLLLVDSHSKWLEVIPVSSTTTARTIQVLRGIFASHGLPDVLVSDNRPQFTSSEFQAFLQANLIWHATSAPFHPASNGQAERMVRTTKDALKRLTHGSWHHRLVDFLLCQRTTPCTATGKSPAELCWGRRGRIFAKLDLAQAYQQLPVDDATAEAQTIVTHQGAFKV